MASIFHWHFGSDLKICRSWTTTKGRGQMEFTFWKYTDKKTRLKSEKKLASKKQLFFVKRQEESCWLFELNPKFMNNHQAIPPTIYKINIFCDSNRNRVINDRWFTMLLQQIDAMRCAEPPWSVITCCLR